jgi:DNA polymerase-3 subunit epsilon
MSGFVAIDFETANEDRANACAFGWAVVEGGEIANTGWTPLDPEIHADKWSVFNSSINGFTADDVRGAPSFADFWPTLRTLVEERPVVAHYAAFDLSVFRAELYRYQATPPPVRYGCSALLSRAAWPDLLSVSLSIVERHLGLLERARDPGQNARACATIALRAFATLRQPDLNASLRAAGLVWGRVEPDLSWTACGVPHRHVRAADVVPRTTEHDPQHALYGQTVVFTGALASMTRREAFQRLVDVGGNPGDGVTRDTNVLVVGEQDLRRLAAGETMSAKQHKALALRALGQDIQLIGEDDFVRSL